MAAYTSKPKALFSSHRIGNLELKNRVVLAPLTRGRAGDDHMPGPHHALYYLQRASAGKTFAAVQILCDANLVTFFV